MVSRQAASQLILLGENGEMALVYFCKILLVITFLTRQPLAAPSSQLKDVISGQSIKSVFTFKMSIKSNFVG